jgi:thioredoxin-related protein
MKALFPSGIVVWLLIISGSALSDSSTGILPTDDWSTEVTEASKAGLPILMLFSSEYCGYCDRLKSEVLEPLAKSGEINKFAWIRELSIDRGGKIRDFDGEKIRTKMFLDRYDVFATPTLVLVDNHGNPLGTPIVGYNNADDYVSLLEHFMDVADWKSRKFAPLPDEHLAATLPEEDYVKHAVTVTQHGFPRW